MVAGFKNIPEDKIMLCSNMKSSEKGSTVYKYDGTADSSRF